MAASTTDTRKKTSKFMLENPSPEMKTFRSDVIWGEIPGDRLAVHWDETIHQEVNYLDEDLVLQILNPDDESVYKQENVNYLNEKEIEVEAGKNYVVRLSVLEKFRVGVITTSEYTPRIAFIPEGKNRYLLTWGELEWGDIRRQVESEHDVNWDNDIEVALKITRWKVDGETPLVEWRLPGMRDMEIITGLIREAGLYVLRGDDHSRLKEIFRVNLLPGKVRRVIDHLEISTPVLTPFLHIQREVHEIDASHIRVFWNIPESTMEEISGELKKKKKNPGDYSLILKLYQHTAEEKIEYNSDTLKKVPPQSDWFFGHVPEGTVYSAQLALIDGEGKEYPAPVIESNKFYIPYKQNEVVLLPIDEGRIFAYWHLNNAEIWQNLVEKHGATAENTKYFIKMFHDYAGGLHHHAHLDREINIFGDSYYIPVESDKIYRAQIIAVVDGWKVEELTPVSNSAQTGRTIPGSAPVSYINHPQPQDHPTNRRINTVMDTAHYSQGKLIFHLHAHLPFVSDGINYGEDGYWRPHGYVEEWFLEAMRETYIPLVKVFDDLIREGVDFKISMDISPTLSNMMRSPKVQEEFLKYIDTLISIAKTEIERTSRDEPWYTSAARMHLRHFRLAKRIFLRYNRDITKAFKKFQDMGKMEISTCAATHGFLPLMGSKYVEAVRGQIETAVIDYQNTFGRRPYGIWLPECAYTSGIEQVLQEFGLRYTFSETHTLLQGDSHVEFGVHAPVYIKGSQIAVFARDPETGKQVWSGDEGYPGDADYLEFHIRGGPLKYNRITDRKGGWKQPYVPEWAEGKASSHAQHFMENRNFRFNYIKHWFWKKPIVVATYDAELFGHHWYEGPRFLYYVLKKLYYDQNQTELTTPSHYLAENSYNQEIYPTTSSWGDKGTFDKWMYGSISWMYRHMNDACQEMINLSSWGVEKGLHQADQNDPGVRMLSQMGRHLLWAQNSDNGFNMSNGHFVDWIKNHFFEDLNSFWELANMFVVYMKGEGFDEVKLRKLERKQHIFPVIDPFAWARR